MELWQEIDLFYEIGWACPTDAEKYQKMLERERTFDFLHGLNPDLDEVRGRLLGVKPFTTLCESFAEVRREESRKRVMLTSPLQDPQVLETRGSALVTNKHSSGRNTTSSTTFDKQVCDYCNKPYHTRETCWDLHGKPADWKPRKLHKNPKSAHLAESKSGLEALLRQFLHQTKLQNSADDQNSKSHTAAMAQTGTISQTLLSMSQQPNCWIVDTGASDHMTGSMEVFDDYTNCHNKINVWVADGKTSPAVGQGMVRLPNMILKSVLFVPKLTYNLLSVSKLTHDMDCVVIFFSSL